MVVTQTLFPFEGRSLDDVVAAIHATDDPDDLDAIISGLEPELEWTPWPHQIAPPGNWSVWCLLGGRGSGKTDGGASEMDKHAQGPPCDPRLPGGHRMSIIGPTLGDCAESCVNGPSGLRAHNPEVEMVSTIGGTIVRWPNGAEAKLFGGHSPADVERFRAGGNRCFAWIEEAAAIPQIEAIIEQIPFGHRLGRNPRVIASTTPKPRAFLRSWMGHARAYASAGVSRRWQRVVITRATTDDNPALDPEVREGLYDLYEGTRLGRQELLGELLEDFEGALWSRHTEDGKGIDDLRVDWADVPVLVRRVVGVDPSTWGLKNVGDRKIEDGELARGIETGIIGSGLSADRHLFTFHDASKRCSPADWADRVLRVYWGLWSPAPARWRCGSIVFETNAGGAMGPAIIQAQEKLFRLEHPDLELPPVRFFASSGGKRVGVMASDGKRARAEPVSALSEQKRHHMVGSLPLLEDQMCQWDPNEAWSPDRLDAMVWSGHALAPWKRISVARGSTAAGMRLS